MIKPQMTFTSYSCFQQLENPSVDWNFSTSTQCDNCYSSKNWFWPQYRLTFHVNTEMPDYKYHTCNRAVLGLSKKNRYWNNRFSEEINSASNLCIFPIHFQSVRMPASTELYQFLTKLIFIKSTMLFQNSADSFNICKSKSETQK